MNTISEFIGEGIRKICDNYGLTPQDREIVNQVLQKWENEGLNSREEFYKFNRKIAIMMGLTESPAIHKALISINAEFVTVSYSRGWVWLRGEMSPEI